MQEQFKSQFLLMRESNKSEEPIRDPGAERRDSQRRCWSHLKLKGPCTDRTVTAPLTSDLMVLPAPLPWWLHHPCVYMAQQWLSLALLIIFVASFLCCSWLWVLITFVTHPIGTHWSWFCILPAFNVPHEQILHILLMWQLYIPHFHIVLPEDMMS